MKIEEIREFIFAQYKLEELAFKKETKEKKGKFKPYVSEEPVFGIFAEKLKTALGKTKKK